MTQSIDSTWLNPVRSRRQALGLLGAGALMLGIGAAPATARGQNDGDNVLTEALVLRDPDIPVAGNANGDITIVEYFDYNCPYCRKIAPELRQVVQDDGKVRLVLKDWPILGPISVVASRMALASKYQDKYVQAHEALIGLNSKLRAAAARGAGRRGYRCRSHHARPRRQRQDDRCDPGAQRRSSQGVRFQGHAVLYRRKIPRAGRAHHGGVRSGHCRCAKGGGEQIAA